MVNSLKLRKVLPSLQEKLVEETKMAHSGRDDLTAAIRKGNLLEIRQCVESIPKDQRNEVLNYHLSDSVALAPLHTACRYGNVAAADILLQYGARVDVAGVEGKYPIHYAAKFVRKPRANEEHEKVNNSLLFLLIKNGADANARDCYLATPLHYAAKRGHVEVVRALLQLTGINAWARDDHQSTALHEAARQGHLNVVDLLLSVKSDIESISAEDDNRCTSFHIACQNGQTKVAEAILNAYCNEPSGGVLMAMQGCDTKGNTALHAAVESGYCHTVMFLLRRWDEELAVLKKRFGYAFNVNTRYVDMKREDGYTALHLAADCGNAEILQIVLSKQPDINSVCKNRESPLFLAVEKNHVESASILLSKGCDTEQSSCINQLTPFLVGCKLNHDDVVKLLLNHGVDVTAVDHDFRNCLILSVENGSDELLQTLLDVSSCKELLHEGDRNGNTAIHEAAARGRLSTLKVLVKAGLPLNIRNDFDETPLHIAAANSRPEVVNFIVTHEQSRLNDQDENYKSPIHVAAIVGDEKTLEEFIKLGAKSDVEDGKSWTPLHMCASRGWFHCAKILLEDDPSLAQKKTRVQETALHLACGVGADAMVDLLLQYNSDVTARLQDGRNALEIAIDNNHENCAIEFLKSDNWKDSLKNVSISSNTGAVSTPLRKMIKAMPNVAELVLTKCLVTNKTKINSKDFEVTFAYELLEDMYELALWNGGEEIISEQKEDIKKMEAKKGPSSHETDLSWENEAYIKESDLTITKCDTKRNSVRPSNKQGLLKNMNDYEKHAKPYNNKSSVLYHNHPLKLMVSANSEALLRHPTVVSLLNYKWNKYGRALFLLNSLCYLIYMAFLNYSMLSNPPRFAINDTKTREDVNNGTKCARVINQAKDVWGEHCQHRTSLQYITTVLVISFSGLQLMKEVGQIIHQRWTYFTDISNFIELVLYSLSILVFVDVDPFARDTGLRTRWQWECSAFAILLSWANLLLYIRRTPLGIYVFMITSVAKSFLMFGIIVLIFLLGFSFSFYVLLQNQYQFYTSATSCVKTLVMMIGELEYSSIFLSHFTSTDYQDIVFYEKSSYAIFLIFIVVMGLLVSNLLVGIAVDDIAAVQEQATMKRLAIQVDGVLDVEYAFPGFIRRRMVTLKQTVKPNKRSKLNFVATWILSQEKLDFKNVTSHEKQLFKRQHNPTAHSRIKQSEKRIAKILMQKSSSSNLSSSFCTATTAF